MSAFPRPACICVAAALLAGCGSSPPSRFFVLEPLAATKPAATSGGPIHVAAVHLPAVLDRTELVRALGSNRLSISDRDRWGAPLGDMARRVLAQDLAHRLPAGMVIFPRSPKPSGARDLVVDVQLFQPTADGRTTLEADWSLLGGDPARPVARRQVRLSEPGAATGADQAAAMSRLLAGLADDIASGLGAPGA